jgi:hypothetical protein
MRSHSTLTRALKNTLIAGLLPLLCSAAAYAGTPSPGADCGAGATIVGSDSAGKVTLGTHERGVPVSGLCTLTFAVPYTNPPACSATNETNRGGFPAPIGTRTTNTTLVIGSSAGSAPGDVISYICADY